MEDGRHSRAEHFHAAADEQSRLLYRQPWRPLPLARPSRPKAGVEIYPGFAVTEAIFGANGAVEGVITGDKGVARDGRHKDNYTPGIALRGKYTLFAEGARGSLTKS